MTTTAPPLQRNNVEIPKVSPFTTLSPEIFKQLHPAHYLSRFLSSGYRPDGRKHASSTQAQWRDVSINMRCISTAHGSALVKMGDTTVVCGIKAEVGKPLTSAPSEGFVVPNIDLPALSSPRFKPGPPGEEAQTYSNWIYELLTCSRTIPLSSLVIAPSKSAWILYIDVVCINYDGNAFDAAVLAVMAALKDTELPAARYDEDKNMTICSRTEKHPLELGRIPLACSVGIFQGTHLLTDPTSFETPLLDTTICIALDESCRAALIRHEGLGGLSKSKLGGEMNANEVLDEVWELAEMRCRELRRLLSM
ncbi:hypothetical protein L204_105309 [Cryptococcus depauperatus]|nr:exosome complex component RRP43 [Cryptococcus depauperatus CBS 7855]